ncbi:MAG: peptidyl-alpha-hydroxyglycine alpha-amidating lyase family protein [Deltaproteobacteria bacterium]|nr:peptidyl-alpha-hydroxyglycine alpha-amidating lyase family protein [Deltaproteobacteria bacterium]
MAAKMGSGRFTYEVQADWAKLPEGWSFLEVVDVAVDAKDRVYVFSRGKHPVTFFDSDGTLLKAWGEGLFHRPHGITIDPEGNLFLVDDGGHVVRKYTPEGQLLLTIGTPGKGAPFQQGVPFNRPTKVAFDPQTRDLYIADGYGNSRIHKYSPDGKHLFSWGGPGSDPGEFNLPHSVCTDAGGLVYVADRENHRIQVFDSQGRYVTQWNNMHRPCGLHLTRGPQPLVYAGELAPGYPFNEAYPNLGPRISIYSLRGERLARLGDLKPGNEPQQFIAPHGLATDSRENLYVGEVSWSFTGSKLNPPRELRSFRKLVRLDSDSR